MALVVMSVVERRLDSVRAVLSGASVVEIAAEVGVSRQSVHAWISRYLAGGVAGLSDRSHRPDVSPKQVATGVDVVLVEMRREHPRWGAKRIRMQLLRELPTGWPEGIPVPSMATVNRVLTRRGLVRSRPRKRPRDSFVRWERPGPMQLWAIDIVTGVQLVDPVTGVLREAKVVTGVDDHSRFCVIATVVERATGRAICLALAAALTRFGVPEEILTDNGKQFTARFGGGRGEVLFDKICRNNAITHRLTAPFSPNQNGKVERFHGTFRPEFLDVAGPFTSIEAAQAAVDAWVTDYNTNRPHQALDDTAPVTPSQRFTPTPEDKRGVVPLWLPPSVATDSGPDTEADSSDTDEVETRPARPAGAVEFDRLIPASGNLTVAGKQFWLGPRRAGNTVRFWADVDVIHLFIDSTRIKSLRSHLSVNDLTRLVAAGAVPAGPPPLPAPEAGDAIEVDRTVNRNGIVILAGQAVLAADILAGRQVSIRIEPDTLMFFDPTSRELLRTKANPLTTHQIERLRGARKAGPPPRPSIEPIRVQRRISTTGVTVVAGQKLILGRPYAGQTVTINVSDTTLSIEFTDGDIRIIRRTTSQPVRSIKAHRPRTVTNVS